MKWKYYIPHIWETPLDRHAWEDIYLMPEEGGNEKASLWLTVDALGPMPDDHSEMSEYEASLLKLGSQEYFMDKDFCNMLVRAEDFNLPELLGYVRKFLEEMVKDNEVILIAGAVREFEGTNEHIKIIEKIRALFGSIND